MRSVIENEIASPMRRYSWTSKCSKIEGMHDAFTASHPPPVRRRDFSTSVREAMRGLASGARARSRAQACEDARALLRENAQLLHEQGLFASHQPKRFAA